MIIMNVEIDNLYCFKNSVLSFTYPRKLSYSSVKYEYLEGRPKFRFKRICIFSGGNASGKTALGRVLCGIQNLIDGDHAFNLGKAVYNKKETASFSIDFVTPEDFFLHRFKMDVEPTGEVREEYLKVPIGTQDSYETAVQKFEKILQGEKILKSSHLTETTHYLLDQVDTDKLWLSRLVVKHNLRLRSSWYYIFNGDHKKTSTTELKNKDIFEKILTTFDPSIQKVTERGNGEYQIVFKNKDRVTINSDGDTLWKDRLSLGTLEAIGTASFVEAVISRHDQSDTFFLDESMAYSHCELEKAIINLLIEKLSPQSQLFITTHNYEILDMNLPIHSFVFFKKEESFTEFVLPEKSFKKHDRSILNSIRNDVFSITPFTTALDSLL